jgi:hypothetical protein
MVPPDISICMAGEDCFENYGIRTTPHHVYIYETGEDILDILKKITKDYGAVGMVYIFGHGWGYENEQNDTYDGGLPGSNMGNTSGFYGQKPAHANEDARDLSDLQDSIDAGLIKFVKGYSGFFIEGCRVGSTGTFARRLADMTNCMVRASGGDTAETWTDYKNTTFTTGPHDDREKYDGSWDYWYVYFPNSDFTGWDVPKWTIGPNGDDYN